MHKALATAILALPSERAVHNAQLEIDSLIDNEEWAEPPPLVGSANVGGEWKTGTSDFEHMTIAEIKECLQWPVDAKADAPFFNTHIDPARRVDPTNGGPWDDTLNANALVPLALQWHQWVGVACALVRIFKGLPVFLMDDVGLGKTFQAIAVMAWLEYLRLRKAKSGKWGGIFGEWRSRSKLV